MIRLLSGIWGLELLGVELDRRGGLESGPALGMSDFGLCDIYAAALCLPRMLTCVAS